MAHNNDLLCVTDLEGKVIGFETDCGGRKKIKIPLVSKFSQRHLLQFLILCYL